MTFGPGTVTIIKSADTFADFSGRAESRGITVYALPGNADAFRIYHYNDAIA